MRAKWAFKLIVIGHRPIKKMGSVPEHSARLAGYADWVLINFEQNFQHNFIVGDMRNEI